MIRIVLGFVLTPLLMAIVSLIAINYGEQRNNMWGDEFVILIIAYYTVFILFGAPYYFFLKKKNYLLLKHFLLNGFFAGIGVLVLMYIINWLQGNSLEPLKYGHMYLFVVFQRNERPESFHSEWSSIRHLS